MRKGMTARSSRRASRNGNGDRSWPKPPDDDYEAPTSAAISRTVLPTERLTHAQPDRFEPFPHRHAIPFGEVSRPKVTDDKRLLNVEAPEIPGFEASSGSSFKNRRARGQDSSVTYTAVRLWSSEPVISRSAWQVARVPFPTGRNIGARHDEGTSCRRVRRNVTHPASWQHEGQPKDG